jgi:ADP-heptose:LPS heptosyltransferase
VWQISCAGEPVVKGCTKRFDNLTLAEIVRLLRECRTWMSVDNMFQHLAWSIGHRGVVVFGPSDPLIFGHAENVNLLRDRKFLRDRQFGLWSEIPWQPEIFSPPDAVVRAVESIMSMNARL